MKKFLGIFLVLAMFVTPAFAESMDLSSMSMDELFALRVALNSEISSRLLGETTAIYSGKYVVGEDIKPGTYVLYADMPSAKYVTIEITWPDNSHESVFEQIKINESFYLNLEEDSVLSLDGIQTAHLEAVATPEWAP